MTLASNDKVAVITGGDSGVLDDRSIAFISRDTLTRVEHGDPAISLGIHATILFVLGLADRLRFRHIAHPTRAVAFERSGAFRMIR